MGNAIGCSFRLYGTQPKVSAVYWRWSCLCIVSNWAVALQRLDSRSAGFARIAIVNEKPNCLDSKSGTYLKYGWYYSRKCMSALVLFHQLLHSEGFRSLLQFGGWLQQASELTCKLTVSQPAISCNEGTLPVRVFISVTSFLSNATLLVKEDQHNLGQVACH